MSDTARVKRARERLWTVGVTGTNGKTTCASATAWLCAMGGRRSLAVTTLGAWLVSPSGDRAELGHARTPGAFAEVLERGLAEGAEVAVVEVTSRALSAGMGSLLAPDVAVLTHLGRDHLDFHRTEEAYLRAKCALPASAREAVISPADLPPSAAELVSRSVRPGRRWARFGTEERSLEAELRYSLVELSLDGSRARVSGEWSSRIAEGDPVLSLSMPGEHFMRDLLAAALAASLGGTPAAALRRGLAMFPAPRGRFEVVLREPAVLVDYAHTPDALVATLIAARAVSSGRLLCVFGCGGGRDEGKRGPMGQVADELADVVVLTTDNPRHEDPAAIASAVLVPEPLRRARWHVELDRPLAIEWAIRQAAANDVIVIAGRGHETEQVLATGRVGLEPCIGHRAERRVRRPCRRVRHTRRPRRHQGRSSACDHSP